MTLIKDTRVAIKQIAFSKIANTNAEYTLLNEMTKLKILCFTFTFAVYVYGGLIRHASFIRKLIYFNCPRGFALEPPNHTSSSSSTTPTWSLLFAGAGT